jgi:hypothetical protein
MAFGYASSQETITVTSNNREISDNLDLQAVASIFGDSENLEDFENRLNDPYTQISNLDLNRDGYVDYLRVVEVSENYTHLVVVQAVIGNDLYQDVATIEVERDRYQVTTIQVVGDPYIYGPNYIIEPVYVNRPIIIVWFWGPYYKPWHSPYYWSYYPHYFRPWHPYHPRIYRTNVYVHINMHNTYHYTNIRKSGAAVNMYHQVHRNDYGNRHPENSFANRNKDITNRSGLNQHRDAMATNSNKNTRPARTAEKSVYKKRELNTVSNDRKVVSKREAPVSKQKSSQYKAGNAKAGSVYRANKRTTSQKSDMRSTKPQIPNKATSKKGRNVMQKTNPKTGYEQTNGQRYSEKPMSNNTRAVKQSRSSAVNKEKAAPQMKSNQSKKSGNVKAKPDRR